MKGNFGPPLIASMDQNVDFSIPSANFFLLESPVPLGIYLADPVI